MIIRPVTPSDYPLLTEWGQRFFGESFHLPYGWSGPSVGTAVAEKDGRTLAALTASQSFYVGPLVHALGKEYVPAIRLLDAEITAAAPIFNVQDAYLSAPANMTMWHTVLRNLGWKDTPENMKWFHKPLLSLPNDKIDFRG